MVGEKVFWNILRNIEGLGRQIWNIEGILQLRVQFGEQQDDSALADYIKASLMLCYNQRRVV